MRNKFEILLEEWRRFVFPNITPRYIEPKPKQDITAIIGPRRAGKTYLLLHIAKKLASELGKENVIYVNFDDERASRNFEEFMEACYRVFKPNEKQKIALLLDEIQVMDRWEGWLRTLHNQQKYIIFVAGSTSKLISKEIATSLRGRYLSYLLLPFSFKEFLHAKEKTEVITPEDKGRMMRLMREYVEFGGFPEVIREESEFEKRKKLTSLYETIFFKDVVERYKIRNYDTAKEVLDILITNYGNRITISKLTNFLNSQGMQIAKKTLWRYVQYFEDAFAIFLLKPYALSKRKQMAAPRKIYGVDTGLALTLSDREEKGRLIENIVFLELLRRKESDFFDVYYYARDDLEVDFVIQKKKKIDQLVQVCYSLSDLNTREREIRSLLKASEQLKCKDLLVITWDYEGKEKIKGKTIKYLPLWKWLLNL